MKKILYILLLSFLGCKNPKNEVVVYLDIKRLDFENLEWKIQGKTLNHTKGLDSIRFEPNEFDTIYYKPYGYWSNKVNAYITTFEKGQKYKLNFDPCSDDFHISNQTSKKNINSNVIVTIHGIKGQNKPILDYGCLGYEVINNKKYTLTSRCGWGCGIDNVRLSDVEICDTSEVDCYSTSFGEYNLPDIKYKIKKDYFSFYYVPLRDKPLIVDYDLKMNKLILK